MRILTGKQRRYLKALANRIRPTVYIGHKGLSPSVVEMVEQTFNTRELIKLKVQRECPQRKEDVADALAKATHSHLIQILGSTILIYRPDPETPKISLP